MTSEQKRIKEFLNKQVDGGLKRYQISNTLIAMKYSEAQVGAIMGINPKSVHAHKKVIKQGVIVSHRDIAVKFHGNNTFRADVKSLVGVPAHSKEAQEQKSRRKTARATV